MTRGRHSPDRRATSTSPRHCYVYMYVNAPGRGGASQTCTRLRRQKLIFTARRNARIASAALAITIPSVRQSVRHTPVLYSAPIVTAVSKLFMVALCNMSSTCPHNMANFGLLAAEIDPVVWGTPTNFNGFCVLAALLHGI